MNSSVFPVRKNLSTWWINEDLLSDFLVKESRPAAWWSNWDILSEFLVREILSA